MLHLIVYLFLLCFKLDFEFPFEIIQNYVSGCISLFEKFQYYYPVVSVKYIDNFVYNTSQNAQYIFRTCISVPSQHPVFIQICSLPALFFFTQALSLLNGYDIYECVKIFCYSDVIFVFHFLRQRTLPNVGLVTDVKNRFNIYLAILQLIHI